MESRSTYLLIPSHWQQILSSRGAAIWASFNHGKFSAPPSFDVSAKGAIRMIFGLLAPSCPVFSDAATMAEPDKTRQAIRRLVISQVLIVAVLAFCFWQYVELNASKPEVESEATAERPLAVDVYIAQTESFHEVLSGFGTARPEKEVIIAAQVSGVITKIHPKLKVGQPFAAVGKDVSLDDTELANRQLLEIDPRDYEQQQQQALQRQNEIREELKRLDQQLVDVARQIKKSEEVEATLLEEKQRMENGLAKNVATPADVARANLELNRHQNTLEQLKATKSQIPFQRSAAELRAAAAEADQQRLQNILDRTAVMAPFDGVISDVFVEKGRYVRAGDQLARLTDPWIVEIPVALSQDSWGRLQELWSKDSPQVVRLAPNESSNARWIGTLVRVAPEADANSRTVQCFVEVDNNDPNQELNAESGYQKLIPGAFVHARITGREHEAILVPRVCVVEGSVFVVNKTEVKKTTGDSNDVQMVEIDQVERLEVGTGQTYQSLIEITNGLNGGERIVMTNLDILRHGMKVTVQSANTIRSRGILPANNQSLRLTSREEVEQSAESKGAESETE